MLRLLSRSIVYSHRRPPFLLHLVSSPLCSCQTKDHWPRQRRFSSSREVASLERMFRSSSLHQEMFSASFLAALPLDQLQNILTSVLGQVGQLQEVKASGNNRFELTMTRGKLDIACAFDADGKLTGLRILEIKPNPLPLDEVMKQFNSFSGDVSLLISSRDKSKTKEWKNLLSLNEHKPLGVGSAFKMVVLRALLAEIEAGKRRWSDVVELQESDFSLSSMALDDYPNGAPLTLFSLAAAMIAKSDNTATDVLMRTVGRDHSERFLPNSPPRNRPFLTTREFFILKSKGNEQLLQQFRSATTAEARRSIVRDVNKRPLPKVHEFPTSPTALDVEWLFTATELREVIDAVHTAQAMQINPGVAKRESWTGIAFKGGSEPGVINLTHHLRRGPSSELVVAATWNTTGVHDHTAFSLQVQALIAQLAATST